MTQTNPQYLILHGCPPSEALVTPKENRWMNWLANKLNENGKSAIALDLPTPWKPNYSEWKEAFEKYRIDQESILIGHSCDGAFLVRWLLETGVQVQKLILVAPAKIPETPDDTRQDLYDFTLPEDATRIAQEIVLFTSNDLPHHLESLTLYVKALKPRIVRLKDKLHFLYFQMGTNEFPELLEEATSS